MALIDRAIGLGSQMALDEVVESATTPSLRALTLAMSTLMAPSISTPNSPPRRARCAA
jgi:hypothetical protein